ncbi:MAG: hypothetical protein IVW53_03425 [Chloroflexi bacterium]|nr:hypothetical protein [Chloroflexota bacterium]
MSPARTRWRCCGDDMACILHGYGRKYQVPTIWSLLEGEAAGVELGNEEAAAAIRADHAELNDNLLIPALVANLGSVAHPRLAGEATRRRAAGETFNGWTASTQYPARLEAAGRTTGRSHPMTDDRLLDVREEPSIRHHARSVETFDALGDMVTASDPEQARAEALAAEGVEKTRSVIAADKAEKREAANGRARLRRELAQVLAKATVDDIARIIAHDPARARGLKDALTFYEDSRPCPSCGWSGRSHA